MNKIASLIRSLFQSKNVKSEIQTEEEKARATGLDLLRDPLDKTARGWRAERPSPFVRTIKDFPLYEASDARTVMVGDSALVKSVAVMDDSSSNFTKGSGQSAYAVPDQIQDWYISQGFIGYQACALIAQHWLVEKACSQAGEDATRNGWIIKAAGDDVELSKEQLDRIKEIDLKFGIKENLVEFNRFRNVFGIRIALFEVDSEDELYYEKPFNIDGVTEGSYKGISQIDPYWVTPMLSSASTSDPTNKSFYDPDYWLISGKKYHRSHLIIARGPQPADILKPTYIFGGIPLTQRIYERVYAAERTANEAPLLAMNKRTTALHVDMDKAVANETKLLDKIRLWVKFRDNHAVKVLGLDEEIDQYDTSLADFDSVIMNQYQLVAAIAKTPATKLLGTSPKGFNTTGEFEMKSYHQELESIQEHILMPLLSRHYMLMSKSMGLNVGISAVFDPVDSMTAQELADLNSKKAETGERLINIGAISSEEERHRLRDDKRSGYNRLTDADANDVPGMSPENLAALQTSAAEETTANASMAAAFARNLTASAQAEKSDTLQEQPTKATGQEAVPNGQASVNSAAPKAPNVPEQDGEQKDSQSRTDMLLSELLKKMDACIASMISEGRDIPDHVDPASRSVQSSINPSVDASTYGGKQIVGHMDSAKLPRMKVGGMVLCIENPRGSVRKGKTLDGRSWAAKMPNHYGFIKNTIGSDGDEVDCIVGKNLQSQKVFVINQKDSASNEFDEHKCMIGFDDVTSAKNAYLAQYSAGWDGFESIHETDMATFKNWLASGNCAERYAPPDNVSSLETC
jgi:phage-related protein (TIGR01555 family)